MSNDSFPLSDKNSALGETFDISIYPIPILTDWTGLNQANANRENDPQLFESYPLLLTARNFELN
jgi:hypothetical protein